MCFCTARGSTVFDLLSLVAAIHLGGMFDAISQRLKRNLVLFKYASDVHAWSFGIGLLAGAVGSRY